MVAGRKDTVFGVALKSKSKGKVGARGGVCMWGGKHGVRVGGEGAREGGVGR